MNDAGQLRNDLENIIYMYIFVGGGVARGFVVNKWYVVDSYQKRHLYCLIGK